MSDIVDEPLAPYDDRLIDDDDDDDVVDLDAPAARRFTLQQVKDAIQRANSAYLAKHVAVDIKRLTPTSRSTFVSWLKSCTIESPCVAACGGATCENLVPFGLVDLRCGHFLCRESWNRLPIECKRSDYYYAYKRCPLCRMPTDMVRGIHNNAFVMEQIFNLRVTCAEPECGAVYTLGRDFVGEVTHRSQCVFVDIACEACGAMVQRGDMAHHQAHCPSRKVACDHCDEKVPIGDMENHKQDDTCINMRTCKHECREGDEHSKKKKKGNNGAAVLPPLRRFKASELAAHEANDCPLRPTQCELCPQQFPARHLPVHMKLVKYVGVHMLEMRQKHAAEIADLRRQLQAPVVAPPKAFFAGYTLRFAHVYHPDHGNTDATVIMKYDMTDDDIPDANNIYVKKIHMHTTDVMHHGSRLQRRILHVALHFRQSNLGGTPPMQFGVRMRIARRAVEGDAHSMFGWCADEGETGGADAIELLFATHSIDPPPYKFDAWDSSAFIKARDSGKDVLNDAREFGIILELFAK